MYYRRILSLGAQSPELYCNIALCCLYGGQIDLVLPCFQRALATATQPGQKSDIWYNLSFVAVVREVKVHNVYINVHTLLKYFSTDFW